MATAVGRFLLTFLPLFVAIDVLGLLPLFLALTEGLDEADRHDIVLEATLTAGAVGIGFLFVGDGMLHFLGATVGDLQIAGGLLLLVLAVYDLLHPDLPLRRPGVGFGVMPLGIPMIAGPAVLTTLLAVARLQGYGITLIAFALNLLLVWATLRWATLLGRLLGDAGARAIAKVSNLLLAAIGVTMIRQGIIAALRAGLR